jgi:hypothetical protein
MVEQGATADMFVEKPVQVRSVTAHLTPSLEWYKLTNESLARFQVLKAVKMTMLFF